MDFENQQIIADAHGENRWKVVGTVQKTKRWALHKVEDQAPGMRRELFLMTLEYGVLPGKNRSFEIDDLRNSFYRMAEILCANYTFLPEPVDMIRFVDSTGNGLSEEQRNNELGLIFAQFGGFQLPKLTNVNQETTWLKVKQTVRACARTLDALHREQVVIRALPIHTIFLSYTTFKPYFFGFDTLIKMDDFKGHNPNKACLSPEPIHSAPECFDARGYLSPAADVYALGKLVLQIVLPARKYNEMFSPGNPFPDDVQNRINKLGLPDFWARFLALSLHPSPSQRFQNAFEVERYFLSGGKPPAPEKKPGTKSGDKRKTIHKPRPEPWRYRPNPQLPPAALVVWWDRMTKPGQQFNFMALYKQFSFQYRFEPRLLFQLPMKQPIEPDNPFFKILRETYGLEVIDLFGKNKPEQAQALFNRLIPESVNNLILVGHGGQYAVKELFKHPSACDWNIFWIRKGEGQAPIPVNQIIDASLFIRKRNRGSS